MGPRGGRAEQRCTTTTTPSHPTSDPNPRLHCTPWEVRRTPSAKTGAPPSPSPPLYFNHLSDFSSSSSSSPSVRPFPLYSPCDGLTRRLRFRPRLSLFYSGSDVHRWRESARQSGGVGMGGPCQSVWSRAPAWEMNDGEDREGGGGRDRGGGLMEPEMDLTLV